jgi:hypothetical protein
MTDIAEKKVLPHASALREMAQNKRKADDANIGVWGQQVAEKILGEARDAAANGKSSLYIYHKSIDSMFYNLKIPHYTQLYVIIAARSIISKLGYKIESCDYDKSSMTISWSNE